MTVIAKNPIMPGFYPDPSICAVGGDYYLVNSTFAYFPGLPILHSRDLCHWEQIGNALERESQLPLKGAGHSAGLFAPTIRYYDGVFYLICTNVSGGGNFIVTAENPEGPWSEPHFLKGADGIDPSLFFDEDGKCYYIGTHPNPEGCKYNGDWYIWIQELDLKEWKLVGEHRNVWNGAMRDIIWPEGPHLYKKDGYYYIMHAEGGTGPDHAVTVCRSRNIWGPYENNFCNPILTHRHLGKDYPVKYVGHADMIETPEGEWYMVMLAVRPLDGYTTMGRETFLAKVVWENGWPVVNPGAGMLTEQVEIRLPEWNPEREKDSFTCRSGFRNCVPGSSRGYDFAHCEKLGDEFLFLRSSIADSYRLAEGEGLYLTFGSASLKEEKSPSYIAVRQQHHCFEARARVDAGVFRRMASEEEGRNCKAGLALLQNNEYHLRLEMSSGKAEVILCEKGKDQILGSVMLESSTETSNRCSAVPSGETGEQLPGQGAVKKCTAEGDAARALEQEAVKGYVAEAWGDEIELVLRVKGLSAFLAVRNMGREQVLAGSVDIRSLSTEVAGGFVGCTVGMYAAEESRKERCTAGEKKREICFRKFSYNSSGFSCRR